MRPRGAQVGIWAAALALFLQAPTAFSAPNNTANMSCGDPTKDGTLTVVVTLKKGGTITNVSWNAAIAAADNADQKATKIRAAGPPADPKVSPPAGAANVVSVTAIDGWEITGIAFTNDTTNEKSTGNVFAALPSDHDGLCSLEGTASSAGFVEVIANGITANIPISNGMTATQIENQLVAALAGAGARIVPSPVSLSITPRHPGLEGDGRLIVITKVNNAGLSVEVSGANGIEMDVAGLVYDLPVPGLATWGLIALTIGLLLLGSLLVARGRRSLTVA